MKSKLRVLRLLLALLALPALSPLAAQTTPAVVSYTLVNADTDLDIQPLASGAVLDLATLPTRNLNIRANSNPVAVGSVNFALSGTETHASTENVVPYALFSNLNGDYFAWTPAVGAYALTATPYKAIAGGGLAGLGLSISFVVTDSGPLPVVLTAFTATAGAGRVALRWATASETNNREFVVERSTDGQHFAAVGTVAGAGNCLTARAYSYDDNVAPLGNARLCYRLRQVDFAGAVTYSPVRTVAVAGLAAAFTVFPTLATGGLVQYACAGPLTGTEVVELFTLQGQRWGRYAVATGGLGTVPVAELAPGTYLLRLTSDQGRSSQRFVVP